MPEWIIRAGARSESAAGGELFKRETLMFNDCAEVASLYAGMDLKVEFIEHYTGEWALRPLVFTLTMTPLRRLMEWTEPILIRRALGLWAHAYLCLHFSIYSSSILSSPFGNSAMT